MSLFQDIGFNLRKASLRAIMAALQCGNEIKVGKKARPNCFSQLELLLWTWYFDLLTWCLWSECKSILLVMTGRAAIRGC